MKIVFSDKAASQYEHISAFIIQKYGFLSRKKFTLKLDEKLNQLAEFPESSPTLEDFPGYYRSVLTKQTTLFYSFEINAQELYIVSLYDSRQDPSKLTEEIQ